MYEFQALPSQTNHTREDKMFVAGSLACFFYFILLVSTIWGLHYINKIIPIPNRVEAIFKWIILLYTIATGLFMIYCASRFSIYFAGKCVPQKYKGKTRLAIIALLSIFFFLYMVGCSPVSIIVAWDEGIFKRKKGF